MVSTQNTLYLPIWENPLFVPLILVVIIILLWIIRRQYLRSQEWTTYSCPKCGADMHRVHRSNFDHFLSKTLLPTARRYRCENPYCRWSGLRKHRLEEPHRRRRITPAD